MLILVILMPFELWSRWGIHKQSLIGCKHFCIQAVGKLTRGWRYCSFVPPFLLMIQLQNFQMINNHIKTWVWKSAETKLLSLKFFEILIKHEDTRVEHQHHSLTILKTISNDFLTAVFVQCWPSSHMLSLTC